MKNTYNTYKKSGVNMATANKLVNYISKISRKTYKKTTESKSFKNIGSFGSIYDLSQENIKRPIIVSSTDGVGTKIEIANKFKKICVYVESFLKLLGCAVALCVEVVFLIILLALLTIKNAKLNARSNNIILNIWRLFA